MRAFIIVVLLISCFTFCSKKQEQLNVLWLTCEDISPYLACYGDSTAKTPVLDKLAGESMVFTNVYATVGVCAPARSSIITGMYPTSIGTMHMRTGTDYSGWGNREYKTITDAVDINGDTIPQYSAVIPAQVKCFTEYLRAAGYYCTNNAKTDYQFASPPTAWDANGKQAHWKNSPEGTPFFSVFNHEVTHESRIWMNAGLSQTVDPNSVPLPPYYSDTETTRTDVARCYSNIELLDAQIGKKLEELENAGLLDNTIIFFYSDHGGPLPRGKREHYDSGLKVPFMVRCPEGKNAGRYDELISFVDLAPTVLSIAGIKPPEYIEGQAFLGKFKAINERSYIYASGDRFDEFPDRIRMVRDKQFMYVRNYYPELPRYKDVAYRWQIPMMEELFQLNKSEVLNEIQSRWFSKTKPNEELYDCEVDPFQLNNLIDDEDYKDKIKDLRDVLAMHMNTYGDKGDIAELELINEMWPNAVQPKTEQPVFNKKLNQISLSCSTEGSSIAYIISDSVLKPNLDSGWQIYTKPIDIMEGDIVYAIACRIGFEDSDIFERKY